MANTLHDISGEHRDCIPFPAVAAATASGIFASWQAPFTAKIQLVELFFSSAITGQNTASCNFNLLDDNQSVELANVDFEASTDAAVGTAVTLYTATSPGDAVVVDDMIYLQKEKVGNGHLTPHGLMVVTYLAA